MVLADEGPALGGQQLIEADRQRDRGPDRRGPIGRGRDARTRRRLGYFDGLVPVWQDDTLHQVRAARHVFATGTIEQPLVFAGNDLPGVMLAGGARRLAALYAVSPGQRAVVVTTSDRGLQAAATLRDAGRRDRGGGRPAPGGQRGRPRAAAQPASRCSPATRSVEAKGRKAVGRGGDRAGRRRRRAPLRLRPGGRLRRHDPGHFAAAAGRARRAPTTRPAGYFALEQLPDGLYAAGEVAGYDGDDAVAASGELAGLQAAHALGHGSDESSARERELAGTERRPRRGRGGAAGLAAAGAASASPACART